MHKSKYGTKCHVNMNVKAVCQGYDENVHKN